LSASVINWAAKKSSFFGRPEHLSIHELKNSVSGRNDDQSRGEVWEEALKRDRWTISRFSFLVFHSLCQLKGVAKFGSGSI